MEPRFFKRGNASTRWRFPARPAALQWNHVFSNVEIKTPAHNRSRIRPASMEPRFFKRGNIQKTLSVLIKPRIASMEPRFFKRGNLPDSTVTKIKADVLQWNHVFSNVEIGRRRPPWAGARYALQWNHVFSNVEITEVNGYRYHDEWLQWNHVFSNVEINC